jgi:biopolymer transport protein ExbB
MFIDYMQKGGHLMWPLLFCSVLAGAIFLERTTYYTRVSLNLGEFLRGLSNLIRNQRWAEAQVECASVSTPVTRVLHAAIIRHDASREDLKAVVQEAGQMEVPRLEQRLSVLAGIGVVAPLIGLLGTVTGMIEVFSVIASQSGVTSSTELAGGIYQSLLTTAAGLAVAIPCAMGYAFLSSRVNGLLHDMERAGIEVVHMIVDQRGGSQIIDFGTGARASRAQGD